MTPDEGITGTRANHLLPLSTRRSESNRQLNGRGAKTLVHCPVIIVIVPSTGIEPRRRYMKNRLELRKRLIEKKLSLVERKLLIMRII